MCWQSIHLLLLKIMKFHTILFLLFCFAFVCGFPNSECIVCAFVVEIREGQDIRAF